MAKKILLNSNLYLEKSGRRHLTALKDIFQNKLFLTTRIPWKTHLTTLLL